jgi:hypothetical protein
LFVCFSTLCIAAMFKFSFADPAVAEHADDGTEGSAEEGSADGSPYNIPAEEVPASEVGCRLALPQVQPALPPPPRLATEACTHPACRASPPDLKTSCSFRRSCLCSRQGAPIRSAHSCRFLVLQWW